MRLYSTFSTISDVQQGCMSGVCSLVKFQSLLFVIILDEILEMELDWSHTPRGFRAYLPTDAQLESYRKAKL